MQDIKQGQNRKFAICGFIGSGKDTIADYLTRYHGFKRMSFAAALKDAVSVVFGWERELLEGSTKYSREWREQVDPWWAERLSMPDLTPRWVLQYWGTEVLRKGFHDDIWVASVENKLRNPRDNIVLTDCRFSNEVVSIKNIGGTTMRVSRGPNPVWYNAAMTFNKGTDPTEKAIAKAILDEHKVHASEYSSVGLFYDHVVTNDTTIDDLHSQIESIINL